MLSEDGKIDFVSELMDVLESFLEEYEARQNPLENELERGLVMSYALGVMRCNLETIWDCVGQAPVFGPLKPRALFEETCAAGEGAIRLALQDSIKRLLESRDLLHMPEP
jgi:hypothetical protein